MVRKIKHLSRQVSSVDVKKWRNMTQQMLNRTIAYGPDGFTRYCLRQWGYVIVKTPTTADLLAYELMSTEVKKKKEIKISI